MVVNYLVAADQPERAFRFLKRAMKPMHPHEAAELLVAAATAMENRHGQNLPSEILLMYALAIPLLSDLHTLKPDTAFIVCFITGVYADRARNWKAAVSRYRLAIANARGQAARPISDLWARVGRVTCELGRDREAALAFDAALDAARDDRRLTEQIKRFALGNLRQINSPLAKRFE